MTTLTAGRFVGASVQRKEDARLLSGRGRFVADIRLPGMVHAAFVRSTVARGRVTRIDLSVARAAPGVVAVFGAADLNPLAVEMRFLDQPAGPRPYMRVLAGTDVRYVGEPLAVVIARDRYLAEDAADLVEIDYEPLPPVLDIDNALLDGDIVHPELGTNIMSAETSTPDRDIDRVFADAPIVVTETFTQQRQTHVPLETRGLVVEWEPAGRTMTVWASTQCPHESRGYCARLVGVVEGQVRVVAPDVGGGFGQKTHVGREESAVVLAATLVDVPVQWIEDRHENLTAAYHARRERATVSMALSRSGEILAARVDHVDDVGAFTCGGLGSAGPLIGRLFSGPYRIPHIAFTSRSVHTNTCGLAPYRGPWMMETLSREAMMDLAAAAAGLDPIEFRRRNVITTQDQPYVTPTGLTIDGVSPAETLHQVSTAIDHTAFRGEQTRARGQGRYIGLGVSLYIEPSALGFGALAVEAATVRIEPRGAVVVIVGTSSHGQGLETTLAQVAADVLGVSIDGITVRQGDTSVASFGGGTVGSRSAVMGGAAVRLAALQVREKMLGIAGHLLEVSPADLEAREGAVEVKGTPAAKVALADLAFAAYATPAALPPGCEPGLEATARYAGPMFTFSNAAHACVAEVNLATGAVNLLRYAVSQDCGVMINPMVVEGQVAGGVVQGIGGALLEHVAYDTAGNPLTTTFLDYLPPLASDVPLLEIGHVTTPSTNPGGHKGMGEGGAIGAPAAVLNAVADALAPLGLRVTELPLSPDRLLQLIEDRR